MSRRSRITAGVFDNPVLVGSTTLLVILVAVYLSYTALNGLPFVPTYDISAEVPSAAALSKHADVRVGGARVGQILELKAMPGKNGRPAYAKLKLALKHSEGPLPVDTTAKVRLGSVLGGKYLELTPGTSHEQIKAGGVLPLSQASTVVDIDEAFRTFDEKTKEGLRRVVGSLGDSFAGRGAQFNDAVASTARLMPALERVLGRLVAPATDLEGFVRGLSAATQALAPVAPALSAMLDHGATTFGAIDAAGNSIGDTIAALPETERVATQALIDSTPALSDAAAIARGLRPAAPLLPPASRDLDQLVRAATPVLRDARTLAAPLETAFKAVDRFSGEPASSGALRVLGGTDLATFGASTFVGLGAILKSAADAQLNCNTASLWARNLANTVNEGDSSGGWIRMVLIGDPMQTFQAATPSSDLHLNYYPNENGTECEAGNEPFAPGQAIGNPAGNQGHPGAPNGGGKR